MAKLISEDNQIQSTLELILLKDQIKNKSDISWIPYKIVLQSAENKLHYEKSTNQGSGDYVFALKPVNELDNLINGIKSYLENKTKNIFSFEPLEPSFELIMEKSQAGFSVTCWIDAGNVISDHYTWDGLGLRFFTSEEKILSFVEELRKEKERWK